MAASHADWNSLTDSQKASSDDIPAAALEEGTRYLIRPRQPRNMGSMVGIPPWTGTFDKRIGASASFRDVQDKRGDFMTDGLIASPTEAKFSVASEERAFGGRRRRSRKTKRRSRKTRRSRK